jgi:hypothetical protein
MTAEGTVGAPTCFTGRLTLLEILLFSHNINLKRTQWSTSFHAQKCIQNHYFKVADVSTPVMHATDSHLGVRRVARKISNL